MKLLYPLILLSNVWFLKGQQRMKTYQPIIRRFNFDSSYDFSNKHCCKLSPGDCDKLLDSTGFVSDLLKGRVKITQGDGWMEFEIINVQDQDAGQYRCAVTEVQHLLYYDYNIELSEVSDEDSQPQPTTVKTGTVTVSQSPGGVLGEDFTDDHRASWNLGLPFTVTVSIAAILLIASILSVILCRFKARKIDKCVEIPHDVPEQEAVDKHSLQQETSGIVYTTVDFKACQERAKVHNNPRMQATQAQKGNCSKEHDVEYSVLACHQ